jgi:hypothetical protein
MTDVGGLVVLLAWIEFVVLAGGMLAVLLHRSGPKRTDRPRPHDDESDD